MQNLRSKLSLVACVISSLFYAGSANALTISPKIQEIGSPTNLSSKIYAKDTSFGSVLKKTTPSDWTVSIDKHVSNLEVNSLGSEPYMAFIKRIALERKLALYISWKTKKIIILMPKSSVGTKLTNADPNVSSSVSDKNLEAKSGVSESTVSTVKQESGLTPEIKVETSSVDSIEIKNIAEPKITYAEESVKQEPNSDSSKETATVDVAPVSFEILKPKNEIKFDTALVKQEDLIEKKEVENLNEWTLDPDLGTLEANLKAMAAKAGWHLVYDSSAVYDVTFPIKYQGSFEEVVLEILTALVEHGAEKKLHMSVPEDTSVNKIMVITDKDTN